jgi:hypothetical protein
VRFRGLTVALVERLAPHAPAGLEVREEPDGHLQLRLDEGRWEAFPLDEPELEEEISADTYDPPQPAFSVLEALDFVQEFVRSELDSGVDSANASKRADAGSAGAGPGIEWEDGEPWADLEDGEIRFGYGDSSFDPIPLDSLRAD